jgi:hypothetical protein
MAAQRIRAANSSGLPRCKSEGTLIDLSEGFSETSFNDVKGELLTEGRVASALGPTAFSALQVICSQSVIRFQFSNVLLI